MTARVDPGLAAARRMAAVPEQDWPADDPGPPEPPTNDEKGADVLRTPRLAGLLLNRSALRALPDPGP